MKKHTLVIIFNRFYEKKLLYLEITEARDGSCTTRQLARKPTAARFDEVLETGEGSYTAFDAYRAEKVLGSPLLKKANV